MSFTRRNAIDIAGQRFGELTARTVAGRNHHGAIWLCECDCGGLALRTTAALRYAARLGQIPACEACRREARAGRRIDYMNRRQEQLRAQWARSRSLYGRTYDDRERLRVARDLEAQGHAPPTEQPRPRAYAGPTWEPPEGVHRTQRAAYLYPLDGGDDREWRCVNCGAFASRVFGCVLCLDPVCPACVGRERHACTDDSRPPSLLELATAAPGALGGKSRENARQLIAAALLKLFRIFPR